jgi:predicted enzyme related to lactoylglutathione lyase
LVADPFGAPVAFLHSESGDPADGTPPAVGQWLWREYVSTTPEDALRFYQNLVGWTAKLESEDRSLDYWVLRSNERGRAGAFRNPWPNVKPNWLPYVRVDDARLAADKARALGGDIVFEPRAEVRNASAAIVRDPSGAVFGLQKYPY